MTYNEFLLSHILMNESANHKDTPYDELFDETIDLYEQFEYSDSNQLDKPIYECLEDFVDNLSKPI